jgi:putative oxidoreductase
MAVDTSSGATRASVPAARGTTAGPLSRWHRTVTPFASMLLRVGVGIVMLAHGWSKLIDWNGWREQVVALGLPAPDVMAALAVMGELLGGAGLILGLLTPLAALGVLAVMVVAIAKVHAGNGLFASNGGWELPLVIGLVALFFVARGGGLYSLDAILARKWRERRVQRREVRVGREAVPAT